MCRFRTRKPLVLFCIGLVVFALCVPAVTAMVSAVLTPLWLVPQDDGSLIRRSALRCDEQPVALLSVLLSRAPPSARVLA